MTTPAAFLFDLDGTLAHTLPDLAASTNHVRQQHGLPRVEAEAVRGWIGDGARALLRRALDPALPADDGAREAALDEAFAAYTAHHEQQCTRESTLFDGVIPHLEELRARGHKLAVVTNKPERFAVPVARFLGLDALCDVIVGGDTLPTKKPDPAMLAHALDRLGAPRAGATMVGDGLQDLRAGKALGVRTIACLFGYGDAAALREERADEYWRAFAKPL